MFYTFFSLGEVLWDLLPSGAKPGGAPVNFAYHAKVLGADAAFLSAVGNDSLGKELIEFFQSIGLSSNLVQVLDGFPTGTVSVELLSDGQPKYTIHENVAWDNISCSNEALEFVKKSDVLCFGTLACRCEKTRNTIFTLLENCRDQTLKILDLNLRAPFYRKEIIELLLQRANVLKLNDDEITILAPMFACPETEPIAQSKWFMRKFGFTFFILTRGANGSILLRNTNSGEENTEISDHPGFPLSDAEISDTVGAGDGFTAAAIHGFLRNWPLSQINETANAYAAFLCTQNGATPDVPDKFKKIFDS